MALFKTIPELKSYLGAIQKNIELDTIISYVTEAELLYIEPFLGADLYSSLLAGYEADTLSGSLLALLPYVQRPLAHFAFFQFANLGNVFISDIGFQQNSTENTTPAPQWAVKEVKNYTCQSADSFLDKMISYLEKNTGSISQWLTSEFYASNRQFLLNSAADLGKRVSIQNSRLGYWYLRPYIRLAEHKYIENTMSLAQLINLKTKEQSGTLSPEESIAVHLAKDALAHYAIYESLPGLSVEITTTQIRATVFQDNFKQSKLADYKVIQDIKEQREQSGKSYLTELKKYLDANPDIFPLYRDSGKYNAPPAVKHYEQMNNSDSTIFYMR